jgi:hypothetical protein
MFFPQCDTPSSTPSWNNQQNCSYIDVSKRNIHHHSMCVWISCSHTSERERCS